MGLYALAEILDQLTMDAESLDRTILAIDFDRFKITTADELKNMYREGSDALQSTRFLHMDSYTAAALKNMTVLIMGKMTHEAAGVLVRQGPKEAIKSLERFRNSRMQDIILSECEECISSALSLNENMTTVLRILSRIIGESGDSSDADYRMRWKDIEPELCANDLSPLVSAQRITILKTLFSKNCAFRDLSAVTGMRTGHLQFHIQALIDNGYAKKVSKGVYSITKKGANALNSLADFSRHMRLHRTIEETYKTKDEEV